MSEERTRRVELQLSESEWIKLLELANRTGRSEAECLRDFIRTCQPGGSGWQHPGERRAVRA